MIEQNSQPAHFQHYALFQPFIVSGIVDNVNDLVHGRTQIRWIRLRAGKQSALFRIALNPQTETPSIQVLLFDRAGSQIVFESVFPMSNSDEVIAYIVKHAANIILRSVVFEASSGITVALGENMPG